MATDDESQTGCYTYYKNRRMVAKIYVHVACKIVQASGSRASQSGDPYCSRAPIFHRPQRPKHLSTCRASTRHANGLVVAATKCSLSAGILEKSGLLLCWRAREWVLTMRVVGVIERDLLRTCGGVCASSGFEPGGGEGGALWQGSMLATVTSTPVPLTVTAQRCLCST